MRYMMAIRIALITLISGILALASMTWGQVRVMRAERDSKIAELKYARAVVRKSIAEVEEFNRALDLHIETLQSSYPRVLQTRHQENSTF